MHDNVTTILIAASIAALLFLIVVLLIASVVRRASNDRKHRKLDVLRREYRERAQKLLGKDLTSGDEVAFSATPGSLAWGAVEEVLLDMMNSDACRDGLKALFLRLGYVTFYENRLASRNPLIKASAIDKLGRMGTRSCLRKLLPKLDETEPEILTLTVRAISRIGAKEGLVAIVERLPGLLGRGLVTRKAMETALLTFGVDAIECLAEYQTRDTDPWIMSCVLETLSHLPPDARSFNMAIEHLRSQNPEVRSKALKVLGSVEPPYPANMAGLVLPLLDDPVWFVRLQAVKSAKKLEGGTAAGPVGKRLFDNNWRVRDEAARCLTQFGTCAIDVFLDALMTDDTYAKESICEEIEISRFADRLIERLDSENEALRTKAYEILRIMHSLRFSTPLMEYLVATGNDQIKVEIEKILAAGAKR
jgi:hypothetical protein